MFLGERGNKWEILMQRVGTDVSGCECMMAHNPVVSVTKVITISFMNKKEQNANDRRRE